MYNFQLLFSPSSSFFSLLRLSALCSINGRYVPQRKISQKNQFFFSRRSSSFWTLIHPSLLNIYLACMLYQTISYNSNLKPFGKLLRTLISTKQKEQTLVFFELQLRIEPPYFLWVDLQFSTPCAMVKFNHIRQVHFF